MSGFVLGIDETESPVVVTNHRVPIHVLGVPGCLHPDTPIFDPVDMTIKTVFQRYLDSRAFHVVALDENCEPVITRAEPPQQFARARMYKVGFDNGEEITVTGGHRFFTGNEYVTVDVLAGACDGLHQVASFHLPTIAGRDLLASLSDAHRRVSRCQIASIAEVAAENYYDFHVPMYENYWACGVFHHNSGKSVLLGHLAEQAVAQGEGVLVLDIKDGQLARDIAARTAHTDKLVYVAPGLTFDQGHTWGINVLEGPAALVVDNVLDVFERTGKLSDIMTQVKQHLTMGLWLAKSDSNATLQTVAGALTDTAVRRELMLAANRDDRLNDRVRAFWREYESKVVKTTGYNTSELQRTIASTIVRLDEFLVGDPVAALLNQPRSTLRLTEWLDAGKLIVCNLVDGVPPRQIKRLGNVLMAMLVNAALTRQTDPANRVWRLIADEFDQLAADSFVTSIDKLRAANIFGVMAHQNLSQVPRELAASLSGAPVKLYFRIAGTDIDTIGKRFGSMAEARMLAKLPKHQVRLYEEDPVEPAPIKGWWLPAVKNEEVLGITAATPDWWAPASATQLREQLETSLQWTVPLCDTRRTASHDDRNPPRHQDGKPASRQASPTAHAPQAPGADPPRPGPAQATPAPAGGDSLRADDPDRDRPLPLPDQPAGGGAGLPLDPDQGQPAALGHALPGSLQPGAGRPVRPETDRADPGLPDPPADGQPVPGGGQHPDPQGSGGGAGGVRPGRSRRNPALDARPQTLHLPED